jgi:hypothetical protein
MVTVAAIAAELAVMHGVSCSSTSNTLLGDGPIGGMLGT